MVINQSISYSMLHLLAERKAGFLGGESTNIIIYLPNGLEFILAYFMVQYANKTVVPINTSTSELELVEMIKACDCSCVITNSTYFSKVKNGTELCELSIDIVNIEKISVGPPHITNSDEVKYSVMLSTSGTTMASKFVMLTAESIITNLKEHAVITELCNTDIPLILLPMTSAYSHTLQMLNYIFHGLSFVIMDKFFTVKNLMDIVRNENITWIECVPLVLSQIDNTKNMTDLCRVRHIGFGGSNIPKEIIESLVHKYPDIIFTQGYGQTESSPLIAQVEPYNYLNKIGSVGKAIPSADIRIIEDKNGCGELIVSGKCIMGGYYKNMEETKRVLKNGYLHTGDIAVIDEDGYIYIRGRKKNLIITSSCNVYPEEIENIIMTNSKIEDVKVYGEKNSIYGEIVVAQIVLKDPTYTQEELALFCKRYLSDYKVPRKFYCVNTIPKVSLGKICRF